VLETERHNIARGTPEDEEYEECGRVRTPQLLTCTADSIPPGVPQVMAEEELRSGSPPALWWSLHSGEHEQEIQYCE
jgi:hypothetical protein